MSPLSLAAIEEGLVSAGVPRDKARERARRELGLVEVRTEEERESDDARLEKQIVAAADKQLRALGFVVINLSQPRHAKYLTPGIPDRLYMHPGRGVAFWWEAKTPTGKQRPDQAQFEEWCSACDWPYVLGTDQVLYGWLIEQRIAAREPLGELLIPLPYTPRHRSA